MLSCVLTDVLWCRGGASDSTEVSRALGCWPGVLWLNTTTNNNNNLTLIYRQRPSPQEGVPVARALNLTETWVRFSAGPTRSRDIDTVIDEAKKVGVLVLVAVAEHSGEFEKLMALSEIYSGFILPCLGVHPVQADPSGVQRSATLQDLEAALPLIEKYKERLLAIGEVGLDFTPRFTSTEAQKNEQRQVFIKQIEIAKQLDLPLNVHSRSAGRPTIKLLKEQGAERVLLHAFDGKPSVALEGVKAGFFFSIPPSIIRSEQQKLVKQLPLESMCLETDSPALGPEKQVRNEPKNILVSCQYIAQVKGLSVEKVMEVTTQNAFKLFPKLQKFMRL